MQRVEFREEIRDRTGDTIGTLANDDELNLWLTLGVRRLWREWNWSFKRAESSTIVTANGDREYDLPTDCQRVTKVVDTTNNSVLRPREDRWLQDEYPDDTEKDRPFYYSDGGLSQALQTSPPKRVLRLTPVPDGAYTIRVTYSKLPAAMTADDHYTPMPEDFDEALVLWCLTRFYRKIEDLQQAADHDQVYRDEVARLIELYGVAQGERFPVVEYEPFLEEGLLG